MPATGSTNQCPRPPPASQSNRALAVGLGREAGEWKRISYNGCRHMKCEAKPGNFTERSVVVCLLIDKGDNSKPTKLARVGGKRIVFIYSSVFHPKSIQTYNIYFWVKNKDSKQSRISIGMNATLNCLSPKTIFPTIISPFCLNMPIVDGVFLSFQNKSISSS